MRRRYTNALHETGVRSILIKTATHGVALSARALHAVQKEIARPRIPAQYRAIITSLSASRLPPVHPAQYGCRPCSLHSAVSCSAITALPGSGCHRPGGSAPILPRTHPCVCRCHRASCAATSDRLPARPPTCPVWSAPRYGCRQRPPGRFRGGTLHDPRRHPLSIPFDRCCPYPLHPRQILDAKEVAVLSPVRDDRLGLVWPHVRQSLLQRRRICCIDVDPVGCLRSPHQQQSQHQRLTRKPRPHLATPCGSEPVPAGYPVGSSSVPRHIHTAYRPQRLHTASQIPDVV